MPYNMFADEDTQDLPYTLLVVTAIHAEKIVSMQSVGLVLVISFVLLLSTMLLGKDIDVLVIAPLETMTRMVKLLSDNPMAQVKSTTFAGTHTHTHTHADVMHPHIHIYKYTHRNMYACVYTQTLTYV
jgi:hypothetical protein